MVCHLKAIETIHKRRCIWYWETNGMGLDVFVIYLSAQLTIYSYHAVSVALLSAASICFALSTRPFVSSWVNIFYLSIDFVWHARYRHLHNYKLENIWIHFSCLKMTSFVLLSSWIIVLGRTCLFIYLFC